MPDEDIKVFCKLYNKLLLKGKVDGKYNIKHFFKDAGYFKFLDEEALPKCSVFLINKFIKNLLLQPYNMRNLVITTRLYFENIIDELIKIKFSHPEAIIDFNFYKKVKIIQAGNILKKDIIEYLLFVNNIRNKYAHNIDYEISDSKFKEIGYFKNVINRVPYKYKKYKIGRNRFMFVIRTIWILFEIIDQHNEIINIRA